MLWFSPAESFSLSRFCFLAGAGWLRSSQPIRQHQQNGWTFSYNLLWHRRPRARQTKEGKPCQVSRPQAGLILPTRCSLCLFHRSPLAVAGLPRRSGATPAFVPHSRNPSISPSTPAYIPPYHPFAVDLRLTHPPLTESAKLPPTPIERNQYIRCVNQLPSDILMAILSAECRPISPSVSLTVITQQRGRYIFSTTQCSLGVQE